jgi:hypothetical protein
VTTAKLDSATSVQCCFSSDDGAWGAAPGIVDGGTAAPTGFWGIGNFDGSDASCSTVYNALTGQDSSDIGVKVYMYYYTGVDAPTLLPTTAPPPVQVQVTQVWDRLPFDCANLDLLF